MEDKKYIYLISGDKSPMVAEIYKNQILENFNKRCELYDSQGIIKSFFKSLFNVSDNEYPELEKSKNLTYLGDRLNEFTRELFNDSNIFYRSIIDKIKKSNVNDFIIYNVNSLYVYKLFKEEFSNYEIVKVKIITEDENPESFLIFYKSDLTLYDSEEIESIVNKIKLNLLC